MSSLSILLYTTIFNRKTHNIINGRTLYTVLSENISIKYQVQVENTKYHIEILNENIEKIVDLCVLGEYLIK